MSRCPAAVAIAFALVLWTNVEAGQPSPFKPPSNLRVFPPDTKLAQLIPAMKNFTQALGVRCQFCHSYTGTDPDTLENFDFASDAVPAKTTARKMMLLSQAVNGDLLKDVGEPAAPGQPKVTCYTCHRGQRMPLTGPGPAR
jgi:photosynthetic reaction center cytochrome c subunit